MDAELYQEKMEKTHREMLCRMLNVKNLSEDLLERYAQVKRLVDRIDGHLTPGDLAMIIISVGDNPEIATELLDESDDKVVEEAVEQPVEEVPELVIKDEDIIAGTVPPPEHPVSGATGQAADKPVEPADKLWSPGMPVNVLDEDELKQGKIVGMSSSPGKALQLTVEFEDGETATFEEDEVEAL